MGKVIAQPSCRDAVVIVPGIMGSELVETDSGQVLWGMSPRGYVRLWSSSVGMRRLWVTDDERAGRVGRVRATGLLRFPASFPGLTGVEPYTALGRVLRRVAHPDAVAEYPYDWRLPVAFSARGLADFAEEHLRRWRENRAGGRSAGLVLVAHSMGGLLARYFTEVLGGAELVRLTVTLGTPFQGSVKAASLLNSGRGAPVPLPRRRLRDLATTLPGVHDLLPTYRCVEVRGGDGESRKLTPVDIADLGGDKELAEISQRDHATMAAGDTTRLRTVVGVSQPTAQSLRLSDGLVTPLRYIVENGQCVDHAGDGTVYEEAALGGLEPVATLPQSHGGLARCQETITTVSGLLTRRRLGPPMGEVGHGVDMSDMVAVGESCLIHVSMGESGSPTCRVVDAATGRQVDAPMLLRRDGGLLAETRLPHPGIYRVEVTRGYAPTTFLVTAMPQDCLEEKTAP